MRPTVAGPDVPLKPFPIIVDSQVCKGFGRGSSELGIPTANIDPDLLQQLDTGVYFGWASVSPGASPEHPEANFNYGSHLTEEGQSAGHLYPMVMSIGWNPFYNNKAKSAEVHICHKFKHNFYGARIKVYVMGHIRPEQNYDNVDDLIADINTDITVALRSLDRPGYAIAQAAGK